MMARSTHLWFGTENTGYLPSFGVKPLNYPNTSSYYALRDVLWERLCILLCFRDLTRMLPACGIRCVYNTTGSVASIRARRYRLL